jgi:hypothetical protein
MVSDMKFVSTVTAWKYIRSNEPVYLKKNKKHSNETEREKRINNEM